jgi:hypothetical protein
LICPFGDSVQSVAVVVAYRPPDDNAATAVTAATPAATARTVRRRVGLRMIEPPWLQVDAKEPPYPDFRERHMGRAWRLFGDQSVATA